MLETAPAGFEEREDAVGVELATYVAPEHAAAVASTLEGWRPTRSAVVAGWETAWQRFHQPVVIDDVWLGPPWTSAPAGLRAVTIRPGMAFGTGAHATTRLCIELLLRQERGPLLDLGCGSGVLAVVGALSGFAPVVAVDFDPVAIAETGENAARNGARIDARLGDVRRLEDVPTALVVANVPADVLQACLESLAPVRAIVSGFQVGHRPEISGYTALEWRERDRWEAAVMVRHAAQARS